jgi:hypothetical protein
MSVVTGTEKKTVLRRNRNGIEVGDRFVKTDDPKTVWVVAGRGSSVAPMPHFQVVQEGYYSRMRTLAESVLLDPDYYRRVSES